MRPLLQCSLRELRKNAEGPGSTTQLGVSARAAHHHSAHRHRDAVHVGRREYAPIRDVSRWTCALLELEIRETTVMSDDPAMLVVPVGADAGYSALSGRWCWQNDSA